MTMWVLKLRRSLIAAAAAAALATLGSSPVFAQEASLEERLQLLEDREAIRSMLERFFEYQESRDLEAYANLFATDGELVLRRGTTAGGPAGILAAMTGDSTGAGAANAPASGMRHILSNVHIVVDGDVATATSRWTLLAPSEDNRTRVGGTGRYIDTLVRENGEWRFQRRVIARDIPVDVEGLNPEVD